MPTTLLKSADLNTVVAQVGAMEREKEFPCDTHELQHIFGHTPLGQVLVLEVIETTAGTLVYWQ